MITRFFSRFPHAVVGILHAARYDFSFQMQLFFIGPAILIFGYIFWPLEKLDILFLGLSFVIILITELQNSSFEESLDHLHPELHEKIGRSKDMASGAVLCSGLFLVFVMLTIVFF